jgi:hypothetical protein
MKTNKLMKKRRKAQARNRKQAEWRKKKEKQPLPDIQATCPNIDDPRLHDFARQLGGPPVVVHISEESGAKAQHCYDNCIRFRRDGEEIVGGYKIVNNGGYWLAAEPHFLLHGDSWRDPTPDYQLSRYVFVPSNTVTMDTLCQESAICKYYVLIDDPRVHQAIDVLVDAEKWQPAMFLLHDREAILQYNRAVEHVLTLLSQVKTEENQIRSLV